jgi:hypothetical protein
MFSICATALTSSNTYFFTVQRHLDQLGEMGFGFVDRDLGHLPIS